MRIGFISTRLAGTDGVSLETAKWLTVLERLGHDCFFFAGESEWPESSSYIMPEAHFNHPEIRSINNDLFVGHQRKPDTSEKVTKLQVYLKGHLHTFVKRYDLQVLIIENALSLPMNIPLGLAITELVPETCIPTITTTMISFGNKQVLNDPESAAEMVEQNYETGLHYYSYSILEHLLDTLLSRELVGCI